MTQPAGAYLFLLGAASGLAVLAISSYRRLSPAWLKWLLVASGVFLVSRYVTMGLFTHPDAPERYWALRRCWYASAIGLTLPSVFAVDQLIRHPAMTPGKLLRWYAPFLAVYAAVMLLGNAQPAADPLIGWVPRLSPAWRLVVSVTQGLFVAGFLAVCGLLARKIPVRRIRMALSVLMAAQAYLALDGLIVAFGGWYPRPFLYSEMAMLLALWYAFETAATQPAG